MLTFPEKILFALILAGSITYFVRRTITLVRIIRLSSKDPEERFDAVLPRAIDAALDMVFQRKVFRKPIVGFLHLQIVWGFFVFAINTINHFVGAFLPGFNLFGNTLLALYYITLADLFAVLIIVGIVGLAFRRHVLRPENLTRPSFESAIVFTFIGGAMLAYLFANATEIAVHCPAHAEHYIVSAFLAQGFIGLNPALLGFLAHVAWWCDALMHLVLVGLLVIPTKHLHLVGGPINLVFKKLRPRGQMTKMDLEDEEAESFGISKIEEFTWKQNLNLYACIECGRCQDFCPAHNSDKPLKPKKLIVDLKDHLLERGTALLKQPEDTSGPAMIGEVVDKEAIWACTTCAACVEHCPMGIEHIDKLTDMRRYLVLTEADFPEQADATFRNMETAGNPWGFAPAERTNWAQGLDVPVFAEKKEAEILYWVGCSGSYDDRSKKISVALAKILKAANVDFAILGEEERCNCESARRLGNEYLYQMATQEIVETLKQYSFKKILTTCPHCFNTFTHEYPEFGAQYEIIHHTDFIHDLIQSKRLVLPAGNDNKIPTVYHDSCYLGRYNKIFDTPRRILESTGLEVANVQREREKGFCCGAGGGRMWLEETIGERINAVRTKELLDSQAQQIAAACPFCVTMLSDGVKDAERTDVQVRDIAEIVAEKLEIRNPPRSQIAFGNALVPET